MLTVRGEKSDRSSPCSVAMEKSDRFWRCLGFGEVDFEEDGAIALDNHYMVGNIKASSYSPDLTLFHSASIPSSVSFSS
jgi:hypothetical protein